MNAAVQIERSPQLDQYERAALRRELSRWGAFQDKRDAFNGYPSMDNVERARIGRGGGQAGHRILCLDWPDDLYPIHARVLMLPEDMRAVVTAVHCNIVLPDGGVLEWGQRVMRIGVMERTARRLYSQALLRIAGLI